MRVLALDASTEALSVALLDGQRAFEHFEIAARAHARELLPAAQALLDEAGLALVELDGLAFGRGPGAFTGLRVAAGLIQGLAGGIDRPVVPVSTLAAIAARCFDDAGVERVRVVQDARMGEIYTALFARGAGSMPQPLSAERVIRPVDLDEVRAGDTLAGNGWPVVAAARGLAADAFAVHERWPHALDIARLALAPLAAGEGVPAAQALPVYVRDDVARKPAAKR